MNRVLGIIGPLAAGKDTAAAYASLRLHAMIYPISSELKRIAHERRTSFTRPDLIQLSRELTRTNGDDYLARIILERFSDELLIMTGMRQLGQIDYLRRNSDLILVGINASPPVRFARLKTRNKTGDPNTYSEFLKIEREEDGESVQQVSRCMEWVDYSILNEGSLDSLYVGTERILRARLF